MSTEEFLEAIKLYLNQFKNYQRYNEQEYLNLLMQVQSECTLRLHMTLDKMRGFPSDVKFYEQMAESTRLDVQQRIKDYLNHYDKSRINTQRSAPDKSE